MATEPLTRRPSSLREVARRVLDGVERFDPVLREFLDHFYADAADRQACIAERPAELGKVEDAYLAAVAEHLALSYALSVPDWTEEPGRSLQRPFFAGGLDSLKAILIVESPTAFRRRLLFVSADALSRPRMDAA